MITSPSSSSILLSPSSSSTSVSGARLILRFQVWAARLCRYKSPLGQPRRPLKIAEQCQHDFASNSLQQSQPTHSNWPFVTITKLIPMILVCLTSESEALNSLSKIYIMVLYNIAPSTWNPLFQNERYVSEKDKKRHITNDKILAGALPNTEMWTYHQQLFCPCHPHINFSPWSESVIFVLFSLAASVLSSALTIHPLEQIAFERLKLERIPAH